MVSVPAQLDLHSLASAYAEGLKPSTLVKALLERMGDTLGPVWISRFSADYLLAVAGKLDAMDPDSLPLYGVPFAIKDNIDIRGLPTTAACPDYAYEPADDAPVIARLLAAGALPLGKTNLDQFATGLNGTRSPYGIVRNAVDPDYISGGSSSGSALAVAKGWASFSLGTDTAGSGRVPAAFNNLVGLKPTRGLLSTRGVVPACRSLDCISIFALNAADAATVFAQVCEFDALDPFARKREMPASDFSQKPRLRIGVPPAAQLQFFGDAEYARLFDLAREQASALDADVIEVDCSALFEAARMLYQGPWVAERYLTVRQLLQNKPDALLPVIHNIVSAGQHLKTTDSFTAQYHLQALKRQADQLWDSVDTLLMPTAGTIYRVQQLLEEPISLNSNLGYYTNFMNLLDYAAVAVPAGFRSDGLPFGVTFFAPAQQDQALLGVAQRWEGLQQR